jgi:tetratricopeptide (TPR) repeat protein
MSLLRAAALRGGGLCLLLVLLHGCATAPQTRQLSLHPDISLPERTELQRVPFYPQQRYQCGPAALATVLNWSGLAVTPQSLIPQVYVPERQGALQLELMGSARRHGRLAYPIGPELQSLLGEIAAGNPVLVLQNLGLSWAPRWHFAVAVGFDLQAQVIVLRSGLDERHQIGLSTFERTWARGNFWGIVVLRPGQLPAEASADKYLKAVVGLEAAQQWQAALVSYAAALQRWPGNLLAQIGLGNVAYQLGDKAAARLAFQAAVQDHPDAGIAHNNLAQVLLESGELEEARQHAERAVALGGPQLAEFQRTLDSIERAIGLATDNSR